MFGRIRNFLFVNSSTKQTIVKNSFWFGFGTAVTKLARAVIIIYVAKLLGAEQYGIFTYALSIVGIFMIFADMGLTNILTRELSKEGNEKLSFLSTAFFVKIGFLLFAIILGVLLGPVISKFKEAEHLIVLISIFVASESMRTFLYSITRAQNKMQAEAGLGITAEIISVIIILVLFLKNPSIDSLALAFIIGNVIGLIITFVFLRKNLVSVFRYFDKNLVKKIIVSSLPFAIMGVFGIFMTNIDSVMIGFWNEPRILGLYAAAQKPIGLLYAIPSLLSVSLFPIISKLVSDAKKNIVAVVQKSYRVSILIAMPIIFWGIILAGPIITSTFGDEYIGAMLTFQILLCTLVFAFPASIFADVLLAEDKQKVFVTSSALGGLTNVILNFILIPKYGNAGYAVATLSAQYVMSAVLYIKVKKTYPVKLWKGTGKILISSILVSPLIYLMTVWSTPLIIILPVSGIVYITLLYFMKEEIILDIKQSFKSTN